MSSAGGRALRKRPGDRWVTVGDQQAGRRVPRGPAGREPGFPDVFPSATSHGTTEGRVCLRRPRGPAVRRTLPETLRDMMVSRRPTGRGGDGGAGEGRGIVTPLSNFWSTGSGHPSSRRGGGTSLVRSLAALAGGGIEAHNGGPPVINCSRVRGAGLGAGAGTGASLGRRSSSMLATGIRQGRCVLFRRVLGGGSARVAPGHDPVVPRRRDRPGGAA
jgi:hypothetical protein